MMTVPTTASTRVYPDGLNLFDPKAAVGNELGQSVRFGGSARIGDVGITAFGGGQNAGKKCTQSAPMAWTPKVSSASS